MRQRTSAPRQPATATRRAGPPTTTGAEVRLRKAKQARMVALARWRDHRASCARCEAVSPPGDPSACCGDGRKRLLRLLAINRDLSELVKPPDTVQGEQLTLL